MTAGMVPLTVAAMDAGRPMVPGVVEAMDAGRPMVPGVVEAMDAGRPMVPGPQKSARTLMSKKSAAITPIPRPHTMAKVCRAFWRE